MERREVCVRSLLPGCSYPVRILAPKGFRRGTRETVRLKHACRADKLTKRGGSEGPGRKQTACDKTARPGDRLPGGGGEEAGSGQRGS